VDTTIPTVHRELEVVEPAGPVPATPREPDCRLEIEKIPEPPKPSAADEEKRMARSGAFFEQYLAGQDKGLQRNSVPRVRANGEPVEEEKNRGP
jgi:hypothetical protein